MPIGDRGVIQAMVARSSGGLFGLHPATTGHPKNRPIAAIRGWNCHYVANQCHPVRTIITYADGKPNGNKNKSNSYGDGAYAPFINMRTGGSVE